LMRGGNTGLRGPQGLPLFKPPYVRLTAIDLKTGTHAWMVPLGDGPRQKLIDMGVPDPGPLGGGAYTGPLVTKTLLLIGLRGSEAPDLVFDNAPVNRGDTIATPVLRAIDKATGRTVHSVELDVSPTGTPMTYMVNGTQYVVLAYGIGSSAGLIALSVK